MQKSVSHASSEPAPPQTPLISFYTAPPPPDAEIGLDEFQSWASDRLKVLDAVDASFGARTPERERQLRATVQKYLPFTRRAPLTVKTRETEKDSISHFILRLAFCKSAQERTRFAKLETELFKLRYSLEMPQQRAQFVQNSGLDWRLASDVELTLLDNLSGLPGVGVNKNAEEPRIYRFPVEECMDLVGKRQVFVRGGHAYVPECLQLNVLAQTFYTRLLASLESLARANRAPDARISQALETVLTGASSASVPDIFEPNSELTLAAFEKLCAVHAVPLCTESLYTSLKTTRHAFYPERNQLIRFLFNAGMPVDETIRLYTKFYLDFDRKKDIEYSIKHWYGLVGSRKVYSAESCAVVCKSVDYSKPGLSSGCPYHKLPLPQLKTRLEALRLDAGGVQETLRLAAENQPRLACTKVLALLHAGEEAEPVSSPNEYFARAYKWETENRSAGAGAASANADDANADADDANDAQ